MRLLKNLHASAMSKNDPFRTHSARVIPKRGDGEGSHKRSWMHKLSCVIATSGGLPRFGSGFQRCYRADQSFSLFANETKVHQSRTKKRAEKIALPVSYKSHRHCHVFRGDKFPRGAPRIAGKRCARWRSPASPALASSPASRERGGSRARRSGGERCEMVR